MNEPDTDELSGHLRHLVSAVLKLDEEVVQAKVHAVSVDGSNYMIHLNIMINGREPAPKQAQAIVIALRHFGLPGIRVTDFHVPAEA
jgi:hypothetical protein